MSKAFEVEEDEFETHFVENPFIKMREKAVSKTLHGKTHLGKGDLDVNEDEHDIILMKESGKFVIKDFEDQEAKKNKEKKLKRTRQEAMGNDKEEMDESSSDDEVNETLKKRM
jgi:hypothetical protein